MNSNFPFLCYFDRDSNHSASRSSWRYTIQVENISGDSMVVTQSIQGATFLPGGGNLTLNLRAQIPGVHDHNAPSA